MIHPQVTENAVLLYEIEFLDYKLGLIREGNETFPINLLAAKDEDPYLMISDSNYYGDDNLETAVRYLFWDYLDSLAMKGVI
jgi:hypothetical protein